MASQTHIIITLIATTIAIHVSSTSAADNVQLINKLCGVTFAPVACKGCIDGPTRPAQPIVSDVDVVIALLRCAEDDGTKLYNDINNAANFGSLDDTTRKALAECNYPLIWDINERNRILSDYVKSKNWVSAKAFIDSDMFSRIGQCGKILARPGVNLPQDPPIFGDLFGVEGDYKVIYQIVSSL